MPKGSRAIVSICADGGQGTVALLEAARTLTASTPCRRSFRPDTGLTSSWVWTKPVALHKSGSRGRYPC